MADKIRKNTFLIKRSNIPGKIPNSGDLQLGELALNTADVILYTSGTTANSIIPIGWDRVSRTGDTMTGGLFTPFLSATTVSATSINRVDYIVFNTGTTSATTVPGTVYFDNTEKALSYNTSINQGVTVNLGQQNYIRVFNNSGADIQRGKSLEILSAYSGLPSVTLALNRKNGFNIIGVSSEIIPNGSEGIAITNGIISDIELTGMTVGSLIYASDSVPGKLDDATKYLTFPLTARTNQIGFVVQTGATTGKLFVAINNENSVLSLTDLQRNVLEGNVISTGVFEFSGLSTYSTTTINVAKVKGWIVNNTYLNDLTPDVQYIEYSGGTNISLPNITTADGTFILINSASTIVQQTTFPTPQQRRENIYLGKVNHPNRSTILNVLNTVDFDVSPMSALRDLWTPLKLINQNIYPSPNGANLNINISSGTLWGNGINWVNNQLDPSSINFSAKTAASFFYRTQLGGTGSTVTSIDPTKYDLNGVITSVGVPASDNATNQRVYLYPTGVINVLYGQTVYPNLTAAVAGLQTETFITYPNALNNGILIGIISVRNDIIADGQSLNNTSYAIFTITSKFGELLGGTAGLSTTTLQQAYDNSSQPEIIINSTLDGLSIKNGTGNADNVTRLLEGINTTNGVTSFIMADGYISGTTLETSAFIANSNGVTANTLNLLTVGSGTPLTNLGVDSLGNVVSGTTGGSTFTGGTVSGATYFINGLTANTISSTTITSDTFNGSGLGLTNIPISGVTNLQDNLNNKFDKSGGTVTGSVLVTGDVTILGTATTINTQTLTVKDNIITINSNYSGNTDPYPATSGIEVLRGSATTASLLWDEPTMKWVAGISGNTKQIIVSGDSLSLLNSGHTHPISEIINLQNSLDSKFDKSGGTITGTTNFTNGITSNTISANTISATTFYGDGSYLTGISTIDTYVTGFTYSNNIFTLTRNNNLSALTQTVNTMTGLTINGNLTVSGGTQSIFSGNSSVELVRITQTGSGDAFVVEDSSNVDSSHFVINASGNTAIGLSQPLNGDKLTVSGNTTIYGVLSATTVYSNSIGVKTTSPSFDLEVNGTFGATSKSFVIKHPTQEGKRLVYGAIEGPEFGVYVRGKVDGDIIELPEEWVGLVDENSITVQLTGDGMFKLLYVKNIKDNKVYISNMIPFVKSTGYYTVYGERKDIDKIKKII